MSLLGAWFLWALIGAGYQIAKPYLGFEASVDDWSAQVYWTGCAFLAIRFGVVHTTPSNRG